jgi:hypothetical protein
MKKPTEEGVNLGPFSFSSSPLCSICRIKTEKTKEAGIFECPQCQRTYDIDKEIVEFEDTLMSPHQYDLPEIEGTGSGTTLLSDDEGSAVDDLYKKERRLGVRPDENVIYYEEFVPDVDREGSVS